METCLGDHRGVLEHPSTSEPFRVRLVLVLGAQYLFAALTDLVTGLPPSFLAIVLFGLILAVALEVQAARSRSIEA